MMEQEECGMARSILISQVPLVYLHCIHYDKQVKHMT